MPEHKHDGEKGSQNSEPSELEMVTIGPARLGNQQATSFRAIDPLGKNIGSVDDR